MPEERPGCKLVFRPVAHGHRAPVHFTLEEYATGASGLQNHGDGAYQLTR
jgi:hypothetical protein